VEFNANQFKIDHIEAKLREKKREKDKKVKRKVKAYEGIKEAYAMIMTTESMTPYNARDHDK